MIKSVILIVLDGWGIGRRDETNPIYAVKPPTFKMLEDNYPVTSLQASGISVGLNWGETGNSEVGHLTMGAGKVLYQHYPRITMAIKDNSFFENPVLKEAFKHARENNSSVNFVGLLSDANTHASIDHLKALIKMAEKENFPKIKLQLFADGVDSPPRSIKKMLERLPLDDLATLIGRYYAMDRENRWQLTENAYKLLTNQTPEVSDTPEMIVDKIYQKNLNDNYIPPTRFAGKKGIEDGDSVIFFNYREDSIRQLAESFIKPDFDKFPRVELKNIYLATFTKYRSDFEAPVAFPADEVKDPLGKVLADHGRTQMRLAESLKYAHVTYFFNGYREPPFTNEYRVLIPSIQLTHPDDQPEMRAGEITARLMQAIGNRTFDFILVNYANPDIIGHTANYEACKKVVSIIDKDIDSIVKTTLNQKDTVVLITGDHGNIEEKINPKTGAPESSHQPNPVPFYVINDDFKGRKFSNYRELENETVGTLADVAPTILGLLGLPVPKEMTGQDILKNLI
ncbi:2,3-bisphosphoglycerate-independent phosphoglycerate mutase [Patescibacteria group bacterium]|nr:2,3-bisphosphoglycerate-independent phosphoglycerate mutase [Patescibacteria group bacterium]